MCQIIDKICNLSLTNLVYGSSESDQLCCVCVFNYNLKVVTYEKMLKYLLHACVLFTMNNRNNLLQLSI